LKKKREANRFEAVGLTNEIIKILLVESQLVTESFIFEGNVELGKLEKLVLNSEHIYTIDDKAFNGLSNLKEIYFLDCTFKEFNIKAFDCLANLELIYFDNECKLDGLDKENIKKHFIGKKITFHFY
jgi:hypothetical protein